MFSKKIEKRIKHYKLNSSYRVYNKNISDEKIQNILNSWLNNCSYRYLGPLFSLDKFVIKDYEDVLKIESSDFDNDTKFELYKNYKTNFNNCTIEKYIKLFNKESNVKVSEIDEMIYKGYSNNPNLYFIDFDKTQTRVDLIQYFYLLNMFLNTENENLKFKDFVKTVDNKNIDNVINNFSLIEIYPHTEYLASFYKKSKLVLGRNLNSRNIEFLLNLNKKTWENLVYSQTYYSGVMQISPIEDFIKEINSNKKIYRSYEIENYFKLLIVKKFYDLSDSSKIINMKPFQEVLLLPTKIDKKSKMNKLYLTEIVEAIKLIEEEINFKSLASIIVGIHYGQTWITSGQNRSLEVMSKILKINNKNDFVKWFSVVVFDYNDISFNAEEWIREYNSINLEINPTIMFSLLNDISLKKIKSHYNFTKVI